MTNEKKNALIEGEEVKDVETAPAAEEEKHEAVEVVEDLNGEIVTDFKIERETFEIDKGDDVRTCFDYFIRARFKKKDGYKELKIRLVPRDVGGYEILDLLFDLYDEDCQFRLTPWSIKARKKGEKDSSGVSYVICSPFEPEKVRLKVNPKEDSDKTALSMFLYFNGFNV